MKTCEWSKVGLYSWCFVAAGKGKNRRTYAEVQLPQDTEPVKAHINATNQLAEFANWEDAKDWVEMEVGKLFKTYR